jgi:hypothetical protein
VAGCTVHGNGLRVLQRAEEFSSCEGLRFAGLLELDSWRRREIHVLSSAERPERLFGPTNHLFRGYEGQSGRKAKLTTYLHLVILPRDCIGCTRTV